MRHVTQVRRSQRPITDIVHKVIFMRNATNPSYILVFSPVLPSRALLLPIWTAVQSQSTQPLSDPLKLLTRDSTPHQEQVLAVGRGFDWLHIPNKALIVGPYR